MIYKFTIRLLGRFTSPFLITFLALKPKNKKMQINLTVGTPASLRKIIISIESKLISFILWGIYFYFFTNTPFNFPNENTLQSVSVKQIPPPSLQGCWGVHILSQQSSSSSHIPVLLWYLDTSRVGTGERLGWNTNIKLIIFLIFTEFL